MAYTITVDTGGTFTDVVLADDSELLGLYKASTTPHDPFEAVESGIRLAAEARDVEVGELLADTSTFVYATTHSTNAILQGKTAKTAFLTSDGHPDILLFREGGKPDAFDFTIETPAPYIPRSLTFEVSERVLADGSVVTPLDEERLVATLDRLAELEVEAIAVCLLWSIVNPVHEQRVGELIEERLPGVKYSLSHRVNPILREYRRAAATALDASIKPLMQTHLEDFEQRLRGLGFQGTPLMVTHVTGGVLHFAEMIARPLYTVDSGPVMAPVAAQAYTSRELADANADAIIVDTGGTSFDVSLLRGGDLVYAREKWLGQRYIGHMTGLPAVDCQSIGAGGGSIAWVDPGGLLRVGPESAGAVPGPACYGRGGDRPTVTDAAVALGYIDPKFFLGGAMELDVEAARRVIERDIAKPLGLDTLRAAHGVLVVAAEEMQKLTLEMTVGQGLDPRECILMAGGGASGLLATLIAQALGISRVLVPNMAAGLSATGAQYPDLIADFQRAVFTDTADFDAAAVGTALGEIDAEIDGFFDELGRSDAERREYTCEARYANQVWELDVPFERANGDAPTTEELVESFHAVHERVFAVKQPGSVVECLNWRGRARRVRDKPALGRPGDNSGRAAPEATRGEREAFFGGDAPVRTPVAFGPSLEQGEAIEGPAIVDEWATTIVLNPGSRLSVTELGNYLIEIDGRESR